MSNIIKSLLIIVTAVAIVAGGTYAYFTSHQTSSANTVATGTLNVAVNGNGGGGTFDIALGNLQNMAPGEVSGPATITVHNNGSLNAATFGRFTLNDTGTGSLANKINFYDYEVKYYNANGTPKSRVDTFVQNGTITNTAFTTASINLLNWVNGEGALDIPGASWDMEGMKPGEFYTLTFKFQMDPSAGNDFQNKTLGFGYEVKATQIVRQAILDLNLGGNMASAIDGAGGHLQYLLNSVL